MPIVRGVRATLNSLVDAARVVASCVRADRRVAIRTWNGSSSCASAIFSAVFAILGGLGSPLGAFVGALLIGVVSELATLVIPPNYRIGIPLCVIALILIFRPQGLFGQSYIRR